MNEFGTNASEHPNFVMAKTEEEMKILGRGKQWLKVATSGDFISLYRAQQYTGGLQLSHGKCVSVKNGFHHSESRRLLNCGLKAWNFLMMRNLGHGLNKIRNGREKQ